MASRLLDKAEKLFDLLSAEQENSKKILRVAYEAYRDKIKSGAFEGIQVNLDEYRRLGVVVRQIEKELEEGSNIMSEGNDILDRGEALYNRIPEDQEHLRHFLQSCRDTLCDRLSGPMEFDSSGKALPTQELPEYIALDKAIRRIEIILEGIAVGDDATLQEEIDEVFEEQAIEVAIQQSNQLTFDVGHFLSQCKGKSVTFEDSNGRKYRLSPVE